MDLVVEDGSGREDANTYASLDYVDTYHSDRNNTFWATGSSTIRKACILRGCDYIEKRFREMYKGYRRTKDQALGWPRIGAYDTDQYVFDDVPKQLMMAQAEYALRAYIYGVLTPDPVRLAPTQDMSSSDPTSNQSSFAAGPLVSKAVTVGPVKTEKTYASLNDTMTALMKGTRAAQSFLDHTVFIPEYPEADLLMEPLLIPGGSDIRMVRG